MVKQPTLKSMPINLVAAVEEWMGEILDAGYIKSNLKETIPSQLNHSKATSHAP
jgi:hypothetical protein